MCKRWVEIHIRKYSNFGISTSSRVEGSHGAMESALTSSSGTIYRAAKKINRRGTERSQQLSVIGSNRTFLLRQEIRNQVETAMLCTAISRFALEIQEAEGIDEICSCTICSRFLLPIHRRWRVQVTLPPVAVPSSMDAHALSFIKYPQGATARKGRPKGMRKTTQKVSDRIEKVRRCRSCHRIGHNWRTCRKKRAARTMMKGLRSSTTTILN
ncbi:hypothetical protein V1527DRAFT_499424 [Lipomyces starkeyi]